MDSLNNMVKNCMENGSFSIEAAVIIPLVVWATLSFMFFSFVLRDVALVESVAFVLFEETKQNKECALLEETAEFEEAVLSKKQLLSEALWWGKLVRFEEINDGDILYEISADLFLANISISDVIPAKEEFNISEKIRFWKVVTDEAKALFGGGNSSDS
ncbi:MAG: hypothetical protein IJW18_08965 [Lachnospiraceae bacterium]|nr:hypothetical protein [Lachnospiraceae bacterium]